MAPESVLGYNVSRITLVNDLAELALDKKEAQEVCADVMSRVLKSNSGTVDTAINSLADLRGVIASTKPEILLKHVGNAVNIHKLCVSYPEFNLKSVAVQDCLEHPMARQIRMLDYELVLRVFCKYSDNIKLLQAHDGSDFDVYIRDIGMSPTHHLKAGRYDVHCCNPCYGGKDIARFHANRQALCVSAARYSVRYRGERCNKFLKSCLNEEGMACCGMEGQHCNVTSPYVMFVHSSYDIGLTDFIAILDKSKCNQAFVVMHFHPIIMTSESGVLPVLDCRFKRYMASGRQRIRFEFENDTSMSYDHDWDTYITLISRGVLLSADGTQRYIVDQIRNQNSTVYLKISRSFCPLEPQYTSFRSIPFMDSEPMVVVLTWDYDILHHSETDRFVPLRIVAPKRLFERITSFALACGPGKYTIQNIQVAAQSFNNREVISGQSVGIQNPMDAITLSKLVTAIYLFVYQQNFANSTLIQKLTDEEKELREYLTAGPWKKFTARIFGCAPKSCKLNTNIVSDGVTIAYDMSKFVNTTSDVIDNEAFLGRWLRSLKTMLANFVFGKPERTHPVFVYGGMRVLTISEDISMMATNCPKFFMPYLLPPTENDLQARTVAEVYHETIAPRLVHDDVALPFIRTDRFEPKSFNSQSVAGDGDCLFHCVIKGANLGTTARNLRLRLAESKYLQAFKSGAELLKILTAEPGSRESWGTDEIAHLVSAEFGITIRLHPNCVVEDDILVSTCCITYNPDMLVQIDIRHDDCHFDLLIGCGDYDRDIFKFPYFTEETEIMDSFLSLDEELQDLGVVNAEKGFRLHADVQHISLTYDKRCYTKWFGFGSGYACVLHSALCDDDLVDKKVLSIGTKDLSSLQYFVDSKGADTTALYYDGHGNNQIVGGKFKTKKIAPLFGENAVRDYFLSDRVSYDTMFDLICINPICYSDKLQPISMDKCDNHVADYLGNLRFLNEGGDLLICFPFVLSKFLVSLMDTLKDHFDSLILTKSKVIPLHNPWMMIKFSGLKHSAISFMSSCFIIKPMVSGSFFDMYDMFGESIMQMYHESVDIIRSVKNKERRADICLWSDNLQLQKFAPPRYLARRIVGGAKGVFSYGLADMKRVLGAAAFVDNTNKKFLARDLRIKLIKWAFSTVNVDYSLTKWDLADAYHRAEDLKAKTILFLAYSDICDHGHLCFDVDIKNQLYKKSVVELSEEFLSKVFKDFPAIKKKRQYVPSVSDIVEGIGSVASARKGYSKLEEELDCGSNVSSNIVSTRVVEELQPISPKKLGFFKTCRQKLMDLKVNEKQKVCKPQICTEGFSRLLDGYANDSRNFIDSVKIKRGVPIVPSYNMEPNIDEIAQHEDFDQTFDGILPVSDCLLGGANKDHCFDDFCFNSSVWIQRVVDDFLKYVDAEVRCVQKECHRAYGLIQQGVNEQRGVRTKEWILLRNNLSGFVNAFVSVNGVTAMGRQSYIGRYVFAWKSLGRPSFVLIPNKDAAPLNSDPVADVISKYDYVFSYEALSIFTSFDILNKYKDHKVGKNFPKGAGLVQAAAGCGKTHSIITSCIEASKRGKSFVILTSTKEGATDVGRKLLNRMEDSGLSTVDYKPPVRTIDSHLINFGSSSVDILFIDEALMSHAGKLLLTIDLVETDYVRAYGDRLQIPFINRLPEDVFVPTYYDPRCVFPIVDILYVSRRVPADVAAVLDGHYKELNAALGVDYGMRSTNRNVPSMSLQHITTGKEVPKNLGAKVLTFLQSDKQLLMSEGVRDVSTVHEYQGKESDHVLLVRLGSHDQKIFSELNHCVTALTRHKKTLTYYTVRSRFPDFIRDTIEKYKLVQLSDDKVKDVLVSIEGGANKSFQILPSEVIGHVEQNNWTVNHCAFVSGKRMTDDVCIFKHSPNEKFFLRQNIFYAPGSMSYGDFKKVVANLNPCKIAVQENFFKNFSAVTAAKILKNNGFQVVRTGDTSNIIKSEVFDAAIISGLYGQPVEVPIYSEQVVLDYEDTLPENCVDFVDYVSIIQSMINGFLPGTPFVDTSYDAWDLHINDFEINVGNLKYGNLLHSVPCENFDYMRPKLSTPAPRKQQGTTRHLLYAFAKRNANPPRIQSIFSVDEQVDKMMDTFLKCVPGANFSPVDVTPQEMQKWVSNQPLAVLSNIVPEESVIDSMVLNAYDMIIKAAPKPDLTIEALDVYPAPQTILYQKKCINAVFCTLWGIIRDRVMDGLHNKFVFFTKMRDEELANWLERKLPSRKRRGKFSWEIDMKKFDKSQHELILMFEAAILKKFKVPAYLVKLWVHAHRKCSVRNKQTGLAFIVDFQRKSGDASTFFGNTLFLMVALVDLFDFDNIFAAMFAGDDSFVITYSDLKLNLDDLAYKYNLEAKVFRYKWGYFCSKFLIPDGDSWYVVPDPLKRAVKLGRTDLRNPDHVEEYRVSFLDNVKSYRYYNVASFTATALKERYGSNYDATFAIQCLYSVAKPENFCDLFFSLPEDVLCYDPSRPSLEL